MTEPQDELLQIADRLALLAERGKDSAVYEPLDALKSVTAEIGKAFSGSWLGYHASVYYRDLKPPPPGAHFTMEWGLMSTYGSRFGSKGNWVEFDPEEVTAAIYQAAGNPDLGPIRTLAEEMRPVFDACRSDIFSILSSEISSSPDDFLKSVKREIEELEILNQSEILRRLTPAGTVMSRDTTAISQGYKTPPHIKVMSEVIELHNSVASLSELSVLARKAGSHMARKVRHKYRSELIEQMFLLVMAGRRSGRT